MRVSLIDRRTLTSEWPKPTPDNRFEWSLVTQFSVQHKQVKSILNCHWNVLRNDPILGPVLPSKAGIIFRGSPSLHSQISHNVIDAPIKPTFFPESKGYYACEKCNVCTHNLCGRKKSESFQSTVTSTVYHMKYFTTCTSRYIVYLITCPCNKQYVGRTIR